MFFLDFCLEEGVVRMGGVVDRKGSLCNENENKKDQEG